MSTIATSTTATKPILAPRFDNGDEFLHSLGDVPMSRVIFEPWPGTATEQDLLILVERDKRLCELIDGTLVEKPMGSYESFLAGWLITYLNMFLEANPLGVVTGEAGPTRMKIGRVRIPDVGFIRFDRLKGVDFSKERISSVAPDLAIEVFSVGNTPAEMQQKTREYFNSGAQLVWIVYPWRRSVEIFEEPSDKPARTLGEGDTIDGGVAIPGFTLELTKLFSKRFC